MNDTYENPLTTRYTSSEMLHIFSNNYKYKTWRKLWLALSRAEQKAGLNITNEQIKSLEDNVDNIDFAVVQKYEKLTKHEVMAHIAAFADVAQIAKPIIHLGESSAFVIDNADIIMYKEALILTQKRLANVMNALSEFCETYKALPTLSYTHFQAAQPTTVGKRASLWLHGLLMDFNENTSVINSLKLRGVKGTTGTAASFKELLNGDYNAYKLIDTDVAKSLGLTGSYSVTSQTYDRKVDGYIASQLSQIAVSMHKITNDLRLLAHLKEIEEPFKSAQVGSSAMPYKRNPMLSERIASLAKFVMSLASSPDFVASTQWLERTLDDSANKRLSLPQMFLSIDACLLLMHNIFSNLQVNTKVIAKNLNAEIPFMITEGILMQYVKNGGDRQKGHEIIRAHSLEAGRLIKEEGQENSLLSLILNDKELNITKVKIDELLKPEALTGFAKEQVEDFLLEIKDVLKPYEHLLTKAIENEV